MANTLATPSWVTKEVARGFVNGVKFLANVNRSYDDQYQQAGAKVGYTVNARLPQRFTVTDGEAMQLQNLYDELVPITLTNQKHVAFSYSSAQATLDLDAVTKAGELTGSAGAQVDAFVKQAAGAAAKKVIVVPGRLVNIVA